MLIDNLLLRSLPTLALFDFNFSKNSQPNLSSNKETLSYMTYLIMQGLQYQMHLYIQVLRYQPIQQVGYL